MSAIHADEGGGDEHEQRERGSNGGDVGLEREESRHPRGADESESCQ
jgi:hypothetical protein